MIDAPAIFRRMAAVPPVKPYGCHNRPFERSCQYTAPRAPDPRCAGCKWKRDAGAPHHPV